MKQKPITYKLGMKMAEGSLQICFECLNALQKLKRGSKMSLNTAIAAAHTDLDLYHSSTNIKDVLFSNWCYLVHDYDL